jgi:hypothetical protein
MSEILKYLKKHNILDLDGDAGVLDDAISSGLKFAISIIKPKSSELSCKTNVPYCRSCSLHKRVLLMDLDYDDNSHMEDFPDFELEFCTKCLSLEKMSKPFMAELISLKIKGLLDLNVCDNEIWIRNADDNERIRRVE